MSIKFEVPEKFGVKVFTLNTPSLIILPETGNAPVVFNFIVAPAWIFRLSILIKLSTSIVRPAETTTLENLLPEK